MNNTTIIKGSNDRPKVEPRIIRPTNRLIIKYYLYVVIIFGTITTGLALFFSFIEFAATQSGESGVFQSTFFKTAMPLYFTVWGIIVLVALVLIPLYVNSMVFSVHGNEIKVKKGLINITEKFVPYFAITNLDIRAGLLDRALGIGTVEIQTAGGGSGSSSSAQPEEKFEGLTVYKEIREYIVQQLHNNQKNKHKISETEKPPKTELQDEIISEIKSIKKTLKNRRISK